MENVNVNAENVNETPETPETPEVDKIYYSPAMLSEKGGEVLELVNAVRANPSLQYRGLDIENDTIPEGWGIYVLPISQRGRDGNELIGVAVVPVPSFDVVANDDRGAEFIQNSVIDAFAAKVANSIRPRGGDTKLGTEYPRTLEDFITSRRGGASGEMKAFNTIAPDVVKFMRNKGLRTLDKTKLRMVLMSKVAAEAEYPKIEQTVWEKILDSMIAKARAEGLDTSVLQGWKETRDEAAIDIGDEIDLDALGDFSL